MMLDQTLSPADALPLAGVQAFFATVERFRREDPRFPATRIAALAYIAVNEGATARDVAEPLGLGFDTLEETIGLLGSRGPAGEPGHGFLCASDDPLAGPLPRYWLTARGRSFVRAVAGA
jgi:hypothetical protein